MDDDWISIDYSLGSDVLGNLDSAYSSYGAGGISFPEPSVGRAVLGNSGSSYIPAYSDNYDWGDNLYARGDYAYIGGGSESAFDGGGSIGGGAGGGSIVGGGAGGSTSNLGQWFYGGGSSDKNNSDTSRITGNERAGGSIGGGLGGTTVTTRTATTPMPTLGAVPAYTAPTYDESKIQAYAQEEAALGIGEWRNSITSGLNKIMSEGNFATRADQMRKLFQGAGQSLSNIMKNAKSEARNRYAQEYNTLVNQALINHEDEVRRVYTQFQADLQNYFNTMQTTSTRGGSSSSLSSGMVIQGGSYGTSIFRG